MYEVKNIAARLREKLNSFDSKEARDEYLASLSRAYDEDNYKDEFLSEVQRLALSKLDKKRTAEEKAEAVLLGDGDNGKMRFVRIS
ncbi:MAG: hypothetical protein LBN02_03230 [Oscillospiraceae bacterium]|nr:hypothetical protein [Oscillospiraceae bacterium]